MPAQIAERSWRVMAGEMDAMGVVRLALGPSGRGNQLDQARDGRRRGRDDDPSPTRRREDGADRPVAGGIECSEALAPGEEAGRLLLPALGRELDGMCHAASLAAGEIR